MSKSQSAGSEQELPGIYPGDYVEQVELRDGTPVTIRPIRPDDAPKLQSGFLRLSPQSVYLRFLDSFKELSDEQAHAFSTLDYQTRMALVAETREGETANLIGVARYALIDPEQPGTAESAIVVLDEYQKRGLGSIMLRLLVKYAIEHGVETFLATVHLSNTAILRFIQRSGFPFEKKMLEPGVWEIRIHVGQGRDGR